MASWVPLREHLELQAENDRLKRELAEERELRHGLDDGGRAAAQRVVELEERIEELERKLASIRRFDCCRDAQRVYDCEKRIKDLERRNNILDVRAANMERERDEARRLAAKYRNQAYPYSPQRRAKPKLPWEEGE